MPSLSKKGESVGSNCIGLIKDLTRFDLLRPYVNILTFTLILIGFVVSCSPIQVMPSPTPIVPLEGWRLSWHDEFDSASIDPNNWTFDIGGGGWGNGEGEYYTSRPENARIENGMLVIEARQEKYEGSNYTSARLKTQGLQTFQFGRIEARLKVPSGKGLWPAFWMIGSDFDGNNWPDCGEIDIMEYIGKEPDLIF